MPEQEVQMNSTGELNFKLPQQQWTGNEDVQTAVFAGQRMFIKRCRETPDQYKLHYLGLMVGGFQNAEEAKFNAPEFAKSVFGILSGFVKDEPSIS